MTKRDPVLQRAIATAGGVTALARQLGMKNHQAVSKWLRVPFIRLAAVSRATGISMENLRPDLVQEIKDMRS